MMEVITWWFIITSLGQRRTSWSKNLTGRKTLLQSCCSATILQLLITCWPSQTTECRERKNSASLLQADLSFDAGKTAQRVITEAVEVWGRLDVLVNNASQFFPTYVDAVTEQEWTILIQANLTSPFFLSQVYWTAMLNNFLNFWFIIFKLVFVAKLIF